MTDEPTFRDMTTADAELFAADAKKPPHSIETCETGIAGGCWACTFERRMQRLAEDSRDERDYDRRTA